MQRTFSLLAACMLLLLAACGDNPNDPTPQAVAGSYAATVFSVSQGSTTVNLLDAGAVIEITPERCLYWADGRTDRAPVESRAPQSEAA